MATHLRLFGGLLCLSLLVGCANDTPPASGGAGTETGMPAEHNDEAPALSAEDQALADAQKICPVAGSDLGSMGTPYKVMIGDRPVFLCCSHCEGELKKNPEKYLAILDEAKSAADGEPAPEGNGEASAPDATEPPAPPVDEAAPAEPPVGEVSS
ncbi:MAG: hypothetical protein KDA58_02985 [Planctomycetaceae bacterium]|nr:hypothetical protein [Planctomycetaceae bacterium]